MTRDKKFQDFISKHTKEEIETYYNKHSKNECYKYFKISKKMGNKVFNYYNISTKTILNSINKEEFLKYRYNHTLKECSIYFNCSLSWLREYINRFNIPTKNTLNSLQDVLAKYNKEDIEDYYYTHSTKDCFSYFNCSDKVFYKVL